LTMIKVEFCSKLQAKERPVAFQVCDRRYRIKEIVDRWYGVGEVFFKVEADDNNIYLLKYEERQGCWDLVFFQNPALIGALNVNEEVGLIERLRFKKFTGQADRISPYLH
jgi:hypothetical protein